MFIIKLRYRYNSSNNETYENWKNIWDVYWVKQNKTGSIISLFNLRNCSREDFLNFNAIDIYENLDTLDPIDETTCARYCFDFPKNETLPEYGDPKQGGNGTFYNRIYIGL